MLNEKNSESTGLKEQEKTLVEAVFDWKMMKKNLKKIKRLIYFERELFLQNDKGFVYDVISSLLPCRL